MSSQNSLLKTYHRSISGIMLIMFGLSAFALACVTAYAIYYTIKSTENNLATNLNAEAQSKASAVDLWLNNILLETDNFTNQEVIYKFSEESFLYNQKKDSGELPTWATQGDSQETLQNTRNALENNMANFAAKNNFLDANIWDAQMRPLLHMFDQAPSITPDQDTLLRSALEKDEAKFSPIFTSPQGLMLNLAYPIDSTDQGTPVAVLLLNIPVKNPLTELFPVSGEQGMFSHRLMQWTKESGNLLQYIDIYSDSTPFMAGWTTPPGKPLPLMERRLINGQEVYSLGAPLANYNMIATYDVPAYIVEDSYRNFGQLITLIAMVGVGLLFLVFIFGWGFVMSRKKKALEEKMHTLADDVSTKEELLNGINATLVDAVVLTDSLGNIQYANTSFAKMINHEAESLVGFKMGNFLHPDVAERLQEQIDKVVRTESTLTFEEQVSIGGEVLYLQALCAPYFGSHKHVNGVVVVYRDVTDTFLERKAEQKRIEQLMQVLTRTIELENPYLCGHSLALGTLAVQLAQNLKRTPEEQQTLHIAASLSQIGMIGLPQELLNKKEQLTDKERALLQTHVERAGKILENFDFGLPVQETIEQMNERLDGSGYPKHLQGEEISFLARILNLANAFCAMLRPRIYRQPKTLVETLVILDKEKHLYDPVVLAALNAYAASDEGKEFVELLQNQK